MTDHYGLSPLPRLERRVFCNRTLNLRSIQAVGFDMDYTLVHYDTDVWETRAFEYAKSRLLGEGWPISVVSFNRALTSLGLVVDAERGNLVKVNRFGHVRRASHGTTVLGFEQVREVYGASPLELVAPRWQFLDTLFSLSESCLYVQLVDLLDQGVLPRGLSYARLALVVREALDAAHLEGAVKAEIAKDPERYVVMDEQLVPTLLDLELAGKELLLITNSEWGYTEAMMHAVIDRHLPEGRTFRDLFALIVVEARKPAFFSGNGVAFRMVDRSGLLRPHRGPLELPGVYVGGHARLVERSLGLRGDEILYLGDHIFADVHASKELLRWRTGLIVRELEPELIALREFGPRQREINALMQQKAAWEHEYSQRRTVLMRARSDPGAMRRAEQDRAHKLQDELRQKLVELDSRIAPLAENASHLVCERWGPFMRSGNDTSFLAGQIERSADIYTSRVSNLHAYTPFAYWRASRGSLPHDREMTEDG